MAINRGVLIKTTRRHKFWFDVRTRVGPTFGRLLYQLCLIVLLTTYCHFIATCYCARLNASLVQGNNQCDQIWQSFIIFWHFDRVYLVFGIIFNIRFGTNFHWCKRPNIVPSGYTGNNQRVIFGFVLLKHITFTI